MYAYLKRLARTTAAYQLADVLSKVVALGLLPVYTRHLDRAAYGTAQVLLTLVILASIVVRLGVGEALVRFYYTDEDPAYRARVVASATAFVLVTTTLAAALAAIFAGPLSALVLGHRDAGTFAIAVLGLWSFTNLELAYALLRIDERAGAYLGASLANVALTIGLTLALVVGAGAGARGLLGGNFGATTVVLLGLWWVLRRQLALRPHRAELPGMLRFGLPTVPADVSVFALNVIDRLVLYRAKSPGAAGLYSLAIMLSAVVVVTVRAFQYAWPPLAYSIRSDDDARRLYALVATYYVLSTGWIVAGATLLGRWLLRAFATPEFFDAHRALPWVALGWALYGLFLVLVAVAGRARVTTRNFPAALAGLAVNVVLLATLVGPLGIVGAGIALCGAYVVMLVVMHLLTRRLFTVAFEWRRLAQLVVVIGGLAVGGELLLPTAGAIGFVTRLAVLAAIPALLAITRFFRPEELSRLRALARVALRARRRQRPLAAPVE